MTTPIKVTESQLRTFRTQARAFIRWDAEDQYDRGAGEVIKKINKAKSFEAIQSLLAEWEKDSTIKFMEWIKN
jgi:hypothetical protein